MDVAHPIHAVVPTLEGPVLEVLARTTTVHASLFGPFARGDGDASSDIGLLLVRPDGIDEDEQPWASLAWATPYGSGSEPGSATVVTCSNSTCLASDGRVCAAR